MQPAGQLYLNILKTIKNQVLELGEGKIEL